MLDARMGEVYSALYERAEGGWRTLQPPRLRQPTAVTVPEGWVLAGNAVMLFAADVAPAGRFEAMPSATALLRLAPAALAGKPSHPAAGALPLYIRDKVAQTTEERVVERARKELQRGTAVDQP